MSPRKYRTNLCPVCKENQKRELSKRCMDCYLKDGTKRKREVKKE